MQLADQELAVLRNWMMCSAITLIVVGGMSLIATLTAQFGPTIVLGLVGSLFIVGTGIVGLRARHRNNLGQTQCFKIGVIILIIFESIAWLLTVVLICFDSKKRLYDIGTLVMASVFIAFLWYTVRIADKFIVKLKDLEVSQVDDLYEGVPDFVEPMMTLHQD